MQPDLFHDTAAAGGEIDFSLPVLSIRQPWASLIIHSTKDVENRTWWTRVRGPVLIHAGLQPDCTIEELNAFVRERDICTVPGCGYGQGGDLAEMRRRVQEWPLRDKPLRDYPRGGIIGMVDIVDCVDRMDSTWFTGPWGFVLRNARPLPFFPCKGKLGFFRVGKERV